VLLLSLDAPLLEPEEVRYADISRQMLETNQFVVPYLDGKPYLDKPPLLYWVIMGSYRLFGVSEMAARLPVALMAWATVAVVGWWGCAVFGWRAGCASAAVLCLSADFVYRARLVTMNVPLMLFVAIALAAAQVAQHGVRLNRRLWVVSAAAAGLGILSKGPVAAAIIALPMVAYPFVGAEIARTRLRDWLVYCVIAGVVAAPWFIAAMILQPGFSRYFFWTHHVERFVTPFDHAKPFWYYLPQLVVGIMPWPVVVIAGWRSRQYRLGFLRGPLTLCVVAIAWTFLFFSASGCKRSVYLLPIYPMSAFVLGALIASFGDSHRRLAGGIGIAVFLATVVGLGVVFPRYAGRFSSAELIVSDRHVAAGMPAYSYGRENNAVSFYLRRNDVRVLSSQQAASGLETAAWVFVRRDSDLHELTSSLPPTRKFHPRRHLNGMTVGIIGAAGRSPHAEIP
jgi:4-amino-4-deoxy-L-arabinose transferase-like glycosyltransferase